jgi:putative hydrolase of the HAD superfamily
VVAGRPELQALRHLVISSEVGWRKPATEFFEELCRQVGVPPAETAFVGDDPVNDVEGAAAAGLCAVRFDPRRDGPCREPACVSRLGQLLDWFR